MKHEIYNLKCCDGIAPFNTYGQKLKPTSDCMLRSIQVSNLTGNDINFGMIFKQSPDWNNYGDALEGFKCMYGYHVWTENGDNLFESCRQWEVNFNEELDTDQLVMMFDLSHIQFPNTWASAKMIIKDMMKKLKYAKSKGIKYVYFCGLSFFFWEVKNGIVDGWKNWDWFNEEADNAEVAVEKYFAGEEVPKLYE